MGPGSGGIGPPPEVCLWGREIFCRLMAASTAWNSRFPCLVSNSKLPSPESHLRPASKEKVDWREQNGCLPFLSAGQQSWTRTASENLQVSNHDQITISYLPEDIYSGPTEEKRRPPWPALVLTSKHQDKHRRDQTGRRSIWTPLTGRLGQMDETTKDSVHLPKDMRSSTDWSPRTRIPIFNRKIGSAVLI